MTIDMLLDSIDKAKDALSRIDESEDAAVKFALAHTTRMLRQIIESGDLHASRRVPARSAYRMGLAALGLEDAA